MQNRKMMLWAVLILPILYISACTYKSHNGNSAFDAINTGDTEAMVIDTFGTPSVRDKPDILYRRYASRPCKSPCAERLWYENRLSLFDEAWSLEIDQNGRVIDKARWASP